jgi:site-specific DNA-methyltransferase (adenine-specific)
MNFSYDTFDYRTIAFKQYQHQTSKPVPLLRKIIGHYSALGETIFDGFSGSGSLAIACTDMGRRCIMVEQSEEHYINAGKRVKRHLSEPRMFTGVNDIEKDSEEYNNTLNLFEEKK